MARLRRVFGPLRRLMSVLSGSRGGGSGGVPSNGLYADDNTSPLFADDNATYLTQG
jgi:hypothetical protein